MSLCYAVLSFRCSNYVVQVLFMSRRLLYFIKRNQRPTSHRCLKRSCFITKSAFNVAENLVMVVNSRSKASLVILANSCEVARSHSSCILSFDLIGQIQNKRFYVMEIVLPVGFAGVITDLKFRWTAT